MSREIKEKWEKEIKRAKMVIEEKRTVDSGGLIREETLEIFRIPRSASEIELLRLADKSDCSFEAMTAIFLMATREGETRTGANLYTSGLGLLVWDPNWDAKTKMKVWIIHQGLKIGCRDDLDFVIKLAYCFWRAEEENEELARKWADYYFVNYQVVKRALDEVKDLLNVQYRIEAEEEEIRGLNFRFLERVRRVMKSIWPEKVVSLEGGEPITYPAAEKGKVGVVSRLCVGNWQEKEKGIVAAAMEGEAILADYPQRVPIASFMVQFPEKVPTERQANLFADQVFPVGSLVQIEKKDGKFYLGKLEELPLPIKVSYQKTLEPSEDYFEEGFKEEKEISFDEDFLIKEEFAVPLEGVWVSEKAAEKARIVGWTERDGIPIALLSSLEETGIKSLGKQIGDTLEVKIHQVARDPIGKRGWMLVQTEEGFNIPVELSEMSLSPWGPGLERIKDQTLNLTVKDIDGDGLPQLSNIDRVINDLFAIRKELSERNTFSGYVVEINEEEETVVAVIQRRKGIVHPFEIHKDFVPGRELSNLRIGEEVIINLSLPRTEKDHIQPYSLTEEEINSIWMLPGGAYDKERTEVFFSYCLKDSDLKTWPARPEARDFVKRHSWQYSLVARIKASKEGLSKLKEMDEIEGVVTQVSYEEDGKTIKSVQVFVQSNISGFAFGSDLGSLSVSEGKRIQFYVKTVDPDSGFLRLVSKESEEEKRRKQEEFIRRTQDNIRRWEANIIKARNAINRIRENIAKNQIKARDAWSEEWKARFQLWIEEDERKIREIERSIQDWLSKIESARSKLREQ